MGVYKIVGTTMKERALLEYNNIPYTYMDESASLFPIKDIIVSTEKPIQEIINMLVRPRYLRDELCAVPVKEERKELYNI